MASLLYYHESIIFDHMIKYRGKKIYCFQKEKERLILKFLKKVKTENPLETLKYCSYALTCLTRSKEREVCCAKVNWLCFLNSQCRLKLETEAKPAPFLLPW